MHFVYTGQLPGFNPLESLIAGAWLQKHQNEYERADFNVRLGRGIEVPADAPDYLHKYAAASTTKRADLIAFASSYATIVEVKARISPGALGQLHVYGKLFKQQFPTVKDVRLVAAGQSIMPDLDQIFSDHSITIELFPNPYLTMQ